jgi:hypothetical protein
MEGRERSGHVTKRKTPRATEGETSSLQPARYLAPGRKTDLETVDDVVGALMERFGGAEAVRGAEVMERWDEFAGEWSRRATPLSVRDGVLILEVTSGGEAALLRYDEGVIRARIQGEFGAGIVRSIAVRVAKDGHR